jgi:hypothetical protein
MKAGKAIDYEELNQMVDSEEEDTPMEQPFKKTGA